jgi:hypothetical protein
MIGSNVYSQSFDPQRYLNQVRQKAEKLTSEINSELDRSNRFTLSQNKKELYFLYNAKGRKFAFPDEFSCNAKIRNIEIRIHNLFDNIINDIPSTAKINGKGISPQEKAELSRQIKAQIEMNCSCRRENNPNYREQYSNSSQSNKFNDGSNSDFGLNNSNTPVASSSLPQNNGVQTQYDNVLDALTATKADAVTTATTTAASSVSNFDFGNLEKYMQQAETMNFENSELYLPNVNRNAEHKGQPVSGIHVGDANNYKGAIPQPPIYLGDRDNYRTANLPSRQDPNAIYAVSIQEKEKGIQLANSLLPKAMEKVASFDKDVELLDKNIALGEKKLFDLEKEKMLVEYEGIIVMKEGMHMPYVMEQFEPTLKEKFNMTDEELKNFRNSVYAKLPPNAVISESMNLGSHTKKALEGDGEAGDGYVFGAALGMGLDFLTADAKEIELSAYDKWQKRLDGDITVLNKQLDGYYTDREKSVRDNADIQKVVSHYSNVIQNGKVTFNSKNEFDAMNLGNVLNDILKK